MKTIYIKYNPYKVETEIRIDDELVKENSQLNVEGKRLQEWVEDLPRILVEECNDDEYKIIFYGTALDFDDVQEILEEAKLKEDFNGIVFEYEHKKGQEVEDKELKIKKIFEEIQKGPFEELKGEDVKKAFEQAQNQDFPVNVVATMSAGKSTLINALLGKKLMPSSQEACTATISEIQDNDKEVFEAQAFDKDGNLCATSNDLNLETMKEWNSNEKISKIEIKGDIPFVNADDTRLILMDTPGPNNARDEAHKETTMRALSESSKTLVLYILNATQSGVNDDNNLLNMVAESMKVGGKQSKDRFIFVVNKLDEFFDKEDDNVESALCKVRKYLEDKGIENPNIYPASALTALNIRTILKEERIDVNLKKLSIKCRNAVNDIWNMLEAEQLHLEQYTLNSSNSLRKKIKNQLENAENIYKNEDESEGMKQLGLIHSGIMPIEEAIRIYTEKYSKTLKIKNIVDTFQKKLESQAYFTKLAEEIAKNKEKRNEFIDKIGIIKKNLSDGDNVKKFKNKIDKISYDKELKEATLSVLYDVQDKMQNYLKTAKGNIDKKEAYDYYNVLKIFAEKMQLEMKLNLEGLLNQYINKSANAILDEYKQRLNTLTSEIGTDNIIIDINPFAMIEGEIPSLEKLNLKEKIRKEKIGEKEHGNKDKRWWKPWTWLDDEYYVEDIYKDVPYYDKLDFAAKFFVPFRKNLISNQQEALDYAKKSSNNVKNAYKEVFNELDCIIKKKIRQLEVCTEQQNNTEKIIENLKRKNEWLKNVSKKVNKILDV